MTGKKRAPKYRRNWKIFEPNLFGNYFLSVLVIYVYGIMIDRTTSGQYIITNAYYYTEDRCYTYLSALLSSSSMSLNASSPLALHRKLPLLLLLNIYNNRKILVFYDELIGIRSIIQIRNTYLETVINRGR